MKGNSVRHSTEVVLLLLLLLVFVVAKGTILRPVFISHMQNY